MKYFKMRESKRKISFIMALALIVSLLPVSPVVKAALRLFANTLLSSPEKP